MRTRTGNPIERSPRCNSSTTDEAREWRTSDEQIAPAHSRFTQLNAIDPID
jgi:hypothetical protein